MERKVALVSVDGVRPEAVTACSHLFYRSLASQSAYTMDGRSITPSITLPCHTSMFYGVDIARHGITANHWNPPARPVASVVEAAHRAGASTAMCYTWDTLRDMAAPGHVDHTYHFAKQHTFEGELYADRDVARMAVMFTHAYTPDLLFLYLSATDWCGHQYGWMSDEYMRAAANASACLESLSLALDERYTLIVVTGHGGHGRTHGTTKEDMRIPLFFRGPAFTPGTLLTGVDLLCIAPTIATILGFEPDANWEGRSLLDSMCPCVGRECG